MIVRNQGDDMRKGAAIVGLALLSALSACNAAGEERIHAEQGGIAAGGSIIGNTINHENPETLKLLREAIADKNTSEDKRREAEVKAAELSTKLGSGADGVPGLAQALLGAAFLGSELLLHHERQHHGQCHTSVSSGARTYRRR